MDENILFVALLVLFMIFIIQKRPKLILTLILIYLGYFFYKSYFSSPREFILYIQNKVLENFKNYNNPCLGDYLSDNIAYNGNNILMDMNFLPDSMRSGPIIGDKISNINKVNLRIEDYKIDKCLKFATKDITTEELYKVVPILLDYKLYLDRLIKFVINIKTDDNIQKDFLIRKLLNKMLIIFYNSYNVISDKKYPYQTFNSLLYSQKDFNNVLDIFVFLGLNDTDNSKLLQLQKDFNILNDKLNIFVIETVNNIKSEEYNITTSKLPYLYEPKPFNL
jgi:hypothetical protein